MGISFNRSSESDFFQTPYGLTWELFKDPIFRSICDPSAEYFDPACGKNAIIDAITRIGGNAKGDDLTLGTDFLTSEYKLDYGIMNPPFSLFDEFVLKSQTTFNKFATILKTGYFAAYQRNERGVWRHLRHVFLFDRQVDFRSPIREDGCFYVGGMFSGWAIYDMDFEGAWTGSILSVQQYATLGQFKKGE